MLYVHSFLLVLFDHSVFMLILKPHMFLSTLKHINLCTRSMTASIFTNVSLFIWVTKHIYSISMESDVVICNIKQNKIKLHNCIYVFGVVYFAKTCMKWKISVLDEIFERIKFKSCSYSLLVAGGRQRASSSRQGRFAHEHTKTTYLLCITGHFYTLLIQRTSFTTTTLR